MKLIFTFNFTGCVRRLLGIFQTSQHGSFMVIYLI